LSEPHCDRSAVFGDLDGDGDIDVIVGELNGPLRVLRNDAPAAPAGGWLTVQLRDRRPGIGNQRALGARVELSSRAIGAVQRRWIFSGGSFQSACQPIAHFGLPPAWRDDPNLTVTITWPDGVIQRLEQVAPGRQRIEFRGDRGENPS
jgi:enediyne biosynthesis protein E4